MRYELCMAPHKLCSQLSNVNRSKPYPTPKTDGRIDPFHANFQNTDANNQPITSAHSYANPHGGRYVWFSKPKYNNGQEVKQYFPQDPAAKKTDDEKECPRSAMRGTRTEQARKGFLQRRLIRTSTPPRKDPSSTYLVRMYSRRGWEWECGRQSTMRRRCFNTCNLPPSSPSSLPKLLS